MLLDREDADMTVSTILAGKSREVFTLPPHRTMHEAAGILSERKIGAVMIMGADGRIKGILSERDIVRALGKHGAAALEDPVSSHMTSKVVTCGEHQTVAEVMEMMTNGRFRHMPVMHDTKLIGIISIGDVVKHKIAEAEAESRSLRDYIQMAS
jgi:CBS domain-containing protein